MEITAPRGVRDENRCSHLLGVIEAAMVRPIDDSKLEKARFLLLEEEGLACLVELSAVIGSFELFTKITQGTGRPALPKWVTRQFGLVVGSLKNAVRKPFLNVGLVRNSDIDASKFAAL